MSDQQIHNAPSDQARSANAEPAPDQTHATAHTLIRALALYVFPLILLGLLIAVVVGVVRLGVKGDDQTAPVLAEIPATASAHNAPPASDAALPSNSPSAPSADSLALPFQTITPASADLSGLNERINRLEAAQAQSAASATLVQDAVALERAAQSSLPFRAELNAVERGLNEPALILPLRPLADRGVPTTAMLALSFPAAAAKAQAAAQPANADDPLAWLGQWLGTVISVRRTDLSEGTTTQAIINRAEARLFAGDLAGAIQALEALPPRARDALKPWLDQANERLTVEDATRAITARALSRLSAPAVTVNGGEL